MSIMAPVRAENSGQAQDNSETNPFPTHTFKRRQLVLKLLASGAGCTLMTGAVGNYLRASSPEYALLNGSPRQFEQNTEGRLVLDAIEATGMPRRLRYSRGDLAATAKIIRILERDLAGGIDDRLLLLDDFFLLGIGSDPKTHSFGPLQIDMYRSLEMSAKYPVLMASPFNQLTLNRGQYRRRDQFRRALERGDSGSVIESLNLTQWGGSLYGLCVALDYQVSVLDRIQQAKESTLVTPLYKDFINVVDYLREKNHSPSLTRSGSIHYKILNRLALYRSCGIDGYDFKIHDLAFACAMSNYCWVPRADVTASIQGMLSDMERCGERTHSYRSTISGSYSGRMAQRLEELLGNQTGIDTEENYYRAAEDVLQRVRIEWIKDEIFSYRSGKRSTLSWFQDIAAASNEENFTEALQKIKDGITYGKMGNESRAAYIVALRDAFLSCNAFSDTHEYFMDAYRRYLILRDQKSQDHLFRTINSMQSRRHAFKVFVAEFIDAALVGIFCESIAGAPATQFGVSTGLRAHIGKRNPLGRALLPSSGLSSRNVFVR